jgi:hypothetical protein
MQSTQSTSVHDYGADPSSLGDGNGGNGGNGAFNSDDLDDGQYFDDGHDSVDTIDSDEHSIKKQKLN